MKTLFYMGRNDQNKSGVSWKIWRIKREGKRLTTSWGAAEVGRRRKVVPKYNLQTRSWTFPTEQAAREEEQRRIREKLSGGYQRTPRRKA
jgi:predicted DNA-binding WGR domain protein